MSGGPATSARTGGWRPVLVVALFALVAAVLTPSRTALAHPLDQYPQLAYVTVAPTQVEVDLVLTPGVLLAPDVLAGMDTDGDGTVSDAEQQAYVAGIVSAQSLTVDGQPLALTVTAVTFPTELNIQAGYGEIRIDLAAILPAGTTDGTHEIAFTNGFAPTGSAYQVNAFVEGDTVSLGEQARSDTQQSLTVTYAIGAANAADDGAGTATEPATGTTGRGQRLLDFLAEPSRSPIALLLALGLAVVLGALHALTPGHGKTLAAAYLVGSRGTVRHAAALGGIVTFTHTASVIVIGLLALFASQYIVPELLVPALQLLSGILVVALGGRLAWQRWVAVRRQRAMTAARAEANGYALAFASAHGQDIAAGPPHSHGDGTTHRHGNGQTHTHLPAEGRVTARSLVAMGISGGVVPCPEALGIMILAVGLNHVVLGLGLIVSFSLGLAAVLIGIGIALVRSRSLVERIGGLDPRVSGALPLLSAVIVTVLGIGITVRGLTSFLT